MRLNYVRKCHPCEIILADGTLYEAENKAKMTQVLNERTQLTQAMDESEMNWLELQEQIEAIEQSVKADIG